MGKGENRKTCMIQNMEKENFGMTCSEDHRGEGGKRNIDGRK